MSKRKQVDTLSKYNFNDLDVFDDYVTNDSLYHEKQVDTLSENNFNDIDDFDDYITNDSSYHEKRRKKKKTPLTLQQRKDKLIRLIDIKVIILLWTHILKMVDQKKQL